MLFLARPLAQQRVGRLWADMDRYVIRRDGNSVVVDLHKWVQSDKDQAAWTAAQIVV